MLNFNTLVLRFDLTFISLNFKLTLEFILKTAAADSAESCLQFQVKLTDIKYFRCGLLHSKRNKCQWLLLKVL